MTAPVSVAGDWPNDATLRAGKVIALVWAPWSDAARALASDVAALAEPHRVAVRPLGTAGRITFNRNIGTVLAGVLRPWFKGQVCGAQRRPGGGMWIGGMIGCDAFWGIADAMRTVGLLGFRNGIRHATDWGDGVTVGGIPSKLWPSSALVALAAGYGVRADTARDDWRISPAAENTRPPIADAELVRCLRREERRSRSRGQSPRQRVAPDRATMSPADVETLEAMKGRVAALNASVAPPNAVIGGCLAPVFRRSFNHCLRLGGRLYTLGLDGYQSMSPGDRAGITINGEPTVEVDLSASFLTIFLALTGAKRLPQGDLYTVGSLPRQAAKEWMTQSFATGRAAGRWARKTSAETRKHSATAVRQALLDVYPGLRTMSGIVPADILASLPDADHGWAVGQYLTFLESTVIESALGYLNGRGVVGLPMHDAIIVPRKAAHWARDGIKEAFRAQLGLVPRVKWEGSL